MECSKPRKVTRWGIAAVTLPLVVGACTNNSSPLNPSNPSATVSVYVKDAPGNVDSVWVQVNDIVLVGDSGEVSLLDAPTGLVNLTALQDSATALVTDKDVSPGSISQVRFVLGGAVLETTQGDVYAMGGASAPDGAPTTGTLQCPSCAQSGIKVQFGNDVVMQDSVGNGILLDFNVSQSFGHQAGKSGRWIMHPVIHGQMASPGEIEGGDTGGTVLGMVSLGTDTLGDTLSIPACGGEDRTLEEFVPTATAKTLTDGQGNPLEYAGESDEHGQFTIDGLDFDSYALGYRPETVFDSTKLVWQATVTPTEISVDSTTTKATGVSYVVTSVSCDTIAP